MTTDRIQQLCTWMELDSTTGSEQRYLERLEHDLKHEGLTLWRHPVLPGRWNLLAAYNPEPEVVLCTHVDTVPPYIPPTLRDEAVYGRGACDTKGVLVAMVEALARLKTSSPKLAERVGLLLVVGEEVDHIGAKVAETMTLRPKRIILGEPTVCRVARAQKGGVSLRLTAIGKAGHSAFPDAGVSAVHRLLDGLERMRALDWPVDPVIGPTHVNIGRLSGGVAPNVFAPSAEALVFLRVVSDPEALVAQIREVVAPDVTVEVRSMSKPLHFDPPEGVETCVVPFNSDAAWLTTLGPVWLGGPGDIRVAHSTEEHITLAQIELGVALYVHLIKAALEG